MNPMEIVVPKELDDAPHEPVPYFIAAKDGWWKNMPTLFGVAQTQMDEPPPTLMEWTPTFLLNDLKLPKWVLTQAHDFFLHIWNKQKSEASVYILYNRSENEFKLFAPEQYCSVVGVNHRLDREKLPAGFTPVGTIHSHCDFDAYHSGTDKADMKKMPGLHITIGHVDDDEPQMVFALSMGEQQFDVERDSIVDEEAELNKFGYNTMPPHWPSFVHTGAAPWGNAGMTSHHPKNGQAGFKPPNGRQVHHHRNNTNTEGGWRAPKEGHQSHRSAMADRWDWQAWQESHGFDDDWEQMYLLPEERETLEEATADNRDYSTKENDSDDPFVKYGPVIEQAVETMNDLVAWLNSWGFVVQYNITHNVPRAKQQLAAYEAKEMMNDAPTP